MQITLSPDEARELRGLLSAALADLRSEIHHTDSAEFRGRLQERERLLMRLRDQLGADADEAA
jgi:hypothetical protein